MAGSTAWRAASAAAALVVAACAARPAPPPPTPEIFARIGPALDGAATVIGSCHEPQIAGPTRAMIAAARAHLAAARRGGRLASLQLRSDLNLITANIALCNGLDRAAASYRRDCRGAARLGMNMAEIKRTIWCDPDETRTLATTPAHRREQWVYRPRTHLSGMEDRPVGALYFTNGRLTSIRRSGE